WSRAPCALPPPPPQFGVGTLRERTSTPLSAATSSSSPPFGNPLLVGHLHTHPPRTRMSSTGVSKKKVCYYYDGKHGARTLLSIPPPSQHPPVQVTSATTT